MTAVTSDHNATKRRHVPFQTLRVVFALMIREMATSFGRSSLGYLWAILEPIGIIIVFTLAFSIIFKQPPLGSSFLLFYATGYLPFGIYNTAQSKIAVALTQNKALLFYPAVTYTDVILARFALISLTELTVSVILFTGLLVHAGVTVVPNLPYIFVALGMALLLGTSVGLMNATLFEILPSWRTIWKILSRPMFFISAVFYLFDSLPSYIQTILWWNPLVHIIGTLRVGFFPEYEGAYISWLYVVILSLCLMTIGLINLRTSNKFIINN